MARLKSNAPGIAMIGGLLWIAYAMLLAVQPWGELTSRDASGPIWVTNRAAWQFVTFFGAVAAATLAMAVVATARRLTLPATPPGQIGVAMGWTGLLAALAAATGSLLGLPALTEAGQGASTLLVAFGVILLAVDSANIASAQPAAPVLFLVGALGLAGLMAQALVVLTPWMLPLYAALELGIYGIAWVRLGSLLHQNTS